MTKQANMDPTEKLVEKLQKMVEESGITLTRREAEKVGQKYASEGPGAAKIHCLGRGTESGRLLAKIIAKVSQTVQQENTISEDTGAELVRKLPIILEAWDELKGVEDD